MQQAQCQGQSMLLYISHSSFNVCICQDAKHQMSLVMPKLQPLKVSCLQVISKSGSTPLS